MTAVWFGAAYLKRKWRSPATALHIETWRDQILIVLAIRLIAVLLLFMHLFILSKVVNASGWAALFFFLLANINKQFKLPPGILLKINVLLWVLMVSVPIVVLFS